MVHPHLVALGSVLEYQLEYEFYSITSKCCFGAIFYVFNNNYSNAKSVLCLLEKRILGNTTHGGHGGYVIF